MKKARREAILGMDSMKDLFINSILPDRKLKYFRDQPITAKGVTDKHLVLWFFEDSIKKLYFEFLQALEDLSKDPLVHIKNKVLQYIHDLLLAKPEQEQNLLTLLVNKIGDLERKIASRAVFLLLQLLEKHPSMKLIFSKEVEQLIFRPNMPKRTQYYGVTFLNQIPLSKSAADVACANHLVSIYFVLFEQLVQENHIEKEEEEGETKPDVAAAASAKSKKGKKGKSKKDAKPVNSEIEGINAKMMAGLLTGVHRAFPFSDIDDSM